MKRKQLFAMLLAGALAVSAVPSLALGAEDQAFVSAEQGTVEETGQQTEPVEGSIDVPAAMEQPPQTEPSVEEAPPVEEVPPADETPLPEPVLTAEPTAEPTVEPTTEPMEEDPNQNPPATAETPTDTPVPTEPVVSEAPSETPVPSEPGVSEAPSETPVPSGEPSETPVPSGEPSETPVPSGTPSETPVPSGEPSGTPIPSVTVDPNLTPAPSVTPTPGVGVTFNSYNYATLAEAVAAITATGEPAKLEVMGDLSLDAPVAIDGGKAVVIVPGAEQITIKRAPGYTGSLFTVAAGSTLSISGGASVADGVEGADLDGFLTVDATLEGEGAVTGSIVEVTGGNFLLGPDATLTGNNTSAAASAISYDASSTVTLVGGTITGNTTSAEGAAISGEGTLQVYALDILPAAVTVTGNKKNIEGTESEANILLPAGKTLTISGKMAGSSIGLRITDAQVGTPAITVGTGADGSTPVMDVAEAAAQIIYDDPTLTVGPDGVIAEAPPVEEVSPTPTPEVSGTPEQPSATPTVPAEQEQPAVTVRSLEWTSADSVEMYFTFNKDGRYYIKVLNAKTKTPDFSTDELAQNGTDAVAGVENHFSENFSKTLDQSRKVVVCLYFQPSDGGQVVVERYKMDEEVRPARLTGVSADRLSVNEARFVFRSSKAGTFYYQWAKQSDNITPDINCEGEGIAISANVDQTLTISDIDTSEPISVWVRMRDTAGILSGYLQFNLDAVTVTPTPSRQPNVPSASQSRVIGLEQPLEFYPNSFYDFQVIGAGTDLQPPYVKGDVQWKPLYWSMSTNPDPNNPSQANRRWRIGSAQGITAAATYNIYIFFQRVEYDGTQWVEQDTVERVTYQFRSAEIAVATSTPTPTTYYDNSGGYYPGGSSSSGGYYDEDGYYHYYDESDPYYQDSDGTETGAGTSTTPPSTADDSPIGYFLALAFVSILAGSAVMWRKRRRD